MRPPCAGTMAAFSWTQRGKPIAWRHRAPCTLMQLPNNTQLLFFDVWTRYSEWVFCFLCTKQCFVCCICLESARYNNKWIIIIYSFQIETVDCRVLKLVYGIIMNHNLRKMCNLSTLLLIYVGLGLPVSLQKYSQWLYVPLVEPLRLEEKQRKTNG